MICAPTASCAGSPARPGSVRGAAGLVAEVWQRHGGAGGECGVKAESDRAFAEPAGLPRSVIGSLALLAPQSAVAAAVALRPCVLCAGRRGWSRSPSPCAMQKALTAPARDLLALRPGRLGHKNLLQVLSCVGADLAMSAAGPRVNAAAGYLLALLELLAPLSREQRAGWARLGKPPTPGAAPPTVRPPGQRAAWLSAVRADGCGLPGRRPDCAVAGLRSPRTPLACHDI